MRRVAAALLVALIAACTQDPPGTCTSDAQCGGGTICSNGVCAGCDSSADCHAWQGCNVGAHACLALPGMCNGKADCPAWELCDGTHTCVLAPGYCYTAAECAGWQDCTNHTCVAQAGRCDVAADCQTWEQCDLGTHTCVVKPGSCADASGCASYEDCTSHRCVVQAGRCNVDAECGGWWASCDVGTHDCAASPTGGNDVVIWGQLAKVPCSSTTGAPAIAPVTTPSAAKVGFSCITPKDPYVRKDGSVVYINNDLPRSRPVRFVPDPFVWDAVNTMWDYPSNGMANDPLLPVPGCSDLDSVTDLLVQEGTGDIAYHCGTSWFDPAGATTIVGRAYAWNASDAILATDALGELVVLAPGDRSAVPVSGYLLGNVIDARADGDGFLIAQERSGPVWELVRVDLAGTRTLVGAYLRTPPPGVSTIYSTEGLARLDRAGALNARGVSGSAEVVVRFKPDSSQSTVVYSEANAPPGANTTITNLYVKIYGSMLFRGP